MIQMHAIKGKKKENDNVWGDDFVIEVEAKVNNAEYDLYANGYDNQLNYNIIVTNDNDFEETYIGYSSNNIINLPTAGKYYIKCVGTYAGFRLQNSDINIAEFKKIHNWGTNEWQDLERMFINCANLTSIDFEGANLNSVINLLQTFSGCISLETINLSNVDLSNVTSLRNAFSYCNNLSTIDFGLNAFEIVTSLYGTFYSCSSLETINLSNLDLSKVYNLAQTFSGCSNLEDLNFGLNTFENVTTMDSAFFGLNQGKIPDLSKFLLTNLTTFSNHYFSDSAENRTMYEYILSAWSTTQPIKSPSIELNFGSVKATAQAQAYKIELANKGYNITDSGNV